MKTLKISIFLLVASLFSLTHSSCTDEFVEVNSNSSTVYKVDPVSLIYNVQTNTRSSSWEWYYDYYTAQMRWMQYGCRVIGNTPTVYTIWNPNIGAQRYSNCWINTGSYARHIEYYVQSNMPEEAASYSNLIEAAKVTLIYQGIITSDFHGSLAYTEGWNARSGGDITDPKFESQQELYTIWDAELKNAISKFKTNTNQKSMVGYDMAYNGDINGWIKAANALRLRIALRLMKRDITKAKQIATEVLATTSDLPAKNEDGFIFWLEGKYSENGDYYSINDLIRASKGMMNYLNKYNDPRKRMFFRINNLTPENVAEYNTGLAADKQIPTTWGRWEGGTANTDGGAADRKYERNVLDPSGRAISMQAVNLPQTRIFAGSYDKGSGGTWFPNVTYPDFCFMAAEFVLNGVSSNKSAEEWYTSGVRGSLDLWNKVGDFCKVHDYVPMSETEITTFMNQEDIKWNPAKGLEQIYCQSYIEHFKNSNEGWALWKRTGYPTTSSIVALEDVYVGGVKQNMPRRSRFTIPLEGTPNYQNMKARIEDMAKDADFGDMSSEYGRIWWDKK
ncbi:MAG: SusD/RagB family nutrient-binding outer membrane lipoprotein [Prolixibacteraceae bacterium]|nr:SusD/RagB family nutrient-binding outer membrane lipoprotein [Prolixibacteraceae bacterium]